MELENVQEIIVALAVYPYNCYTLIRIRFSKENSDNLQKTMLLILNNIKAILYLEFFKNKECNKTPDRYTIILY